MDNAGRKTGRRMAWPDRPFRSRAFAFAALIMLIFLCQSFQQALPGAAPARRHTENAEAGHNAAPSNTEPFVGIVGTKTTPGQEPKPFKSYDALNPPDKIGDNYTLNNTDVWTIDRDSGFDGNITLGGQSKLVVKNARVTFNGTVWARDKSAISITDSNVTFNVPAVPPLPKEKEYTMPNGFLLFEESSRVDFNRSYIHLYRNDFFVPLGSHRPFQIFSNFGIITIMDCVINTTGDSELTKGTLTPTLRSAVMHGNSHFLISGAYMHGFVGYVNAQGTVDNSNIYVITLNELAGGRNVVVRHSVIDNIYTGWTSGAVVINSTIMKSITVNNHSQIFIMDNSTLIGGTPESHVESDGLMEIHDSRIRDNMYVRTNGTLVLDNAVLEQKGNCVVEDHGKLVAVNGTRLNDITCHGNTRVTLNNSALHSLLADGDSAVYVWNTSIGATPRLGDCVKNNAVIYNRTYVVTVQATVNNLSIPLHVECANSRGESLYAGFTSRPAAFSAYRERITVNGTAVFGYCTVDVHRGGIARTETANLTGNDPNIRKIIKLFDTSPPIIAMVAYDEIEADGTTTIIVRANAADAGIGLENVALVYSANSGQNWKEMLMYPIGNNTYESMIPTQPPGTGISFIVRAADLCSNNATSQDFSYTARSPSIGFASSAAYSSAFILAAVLLVGAHASLSKRRKRKSNENK